MNIIFLDVDGVLNSQNKLIEVYKRTHKAHSGYNYPFDAKALENLKFLVEQTNSKLVITSTWRKTNEGRETLLKVLKQYDLDKKVIGCTPILNSNRGEEIKCFLDGFNEEVNFIILDDDSDMGELFPYLIKTDIQTGLTIENVEKAIEKLTHDEKNTRVREAKKQLTVRK